MAGDDKAVPVGDSAHFYRRKSRIGLASTAVVMFWRWSFWRVSRSPLSCERELCTSRESLPCQCTCLEATDASNVGIARRRADSDVRCAS